MSASSGARLTPRLEVEHFLPQYEAASKRLIVLDFDGTLAPIVHDPALCKPTEELYRCITTFFLDAGNSLWIISGRDQEFLQEHFARYRQMGLAAEHGAFMRYPGESEWRDITKDMDMSWQDGIMNIYERFTNQCEGSNTERKKVALTWHYRNCDEEKIQDSLGQLRDELTKFCDDKPELEYIEGKASFEVRPKTVNKGAIVAELIDTSKQVTAAEQSTSATLQSPGYDFVLCLGDDYTDEAMFQTLASSSLPQESVVTCYVGPNDTPTAAKFHVPGPFDTGAVLETLRENTKCDMSRISQVIYQSSDNSRSEGGGSVNGKTADI